MVCSPRVAESEGVETNILNKKKIDEIFALLARFVAQIGSQLSIFRDNLQVPSSRVKKSKKNAGNTPAVNWFEIIKLNKKFNKGKGKGLPTTGHEG